MENEEEEEQYEVQQKNQYKDRIPGVDYSDDDEEQEQQQHEQQSDHHQEENDEEEIEQQNQHEEIHHEQHQNDVHQEQIIEEQQEFQTPQSYNKQDHEEVKERSTESKGEQNVKSKTTASVFGTKSSKNFIKENQKVKTLKEIQQEKKTQRMSQLSSRNSNASYMGSRMSLILDNKGKGLEWGKVLEKNNMMDRTPTAQSYQKNISREFITKTVDGSSKATTLGQIYSQSKKEKSWHQTNASQINYMYSYKTLDMPDKSESELVPQVLANVEIKQNLNLKSQLDNHNYMRHEEVAKDVYGSYVPKKEIVHNVNNDHVQNMRLKTYTSNVF